MDAPISAQEPLPAAPGDAAALRSRICWLRQQREVVKNANRRRRTRALTASQRAAVLAKTDGRCHICGGEIGTLPWNADHVRPYSGGGQHAEANYLAAHGTCNNYRWDYLPEEFELILKLGVWVRTEIEKGSAIGMEIIERFVAKEARRVARRKRTSALDHS